MAPPPVSLCVFDLDMTLLAGRTILALGEHYGVRGDIERIWATSRDGELAAGEEESRRIAALFQGRSLAEFEAVCRSVALREDALELVEALRGRGFRVGVASASYDVATRAARERLGLDFDAGARLEVRRGRLTGRLLEPEHRGPCGQFVCKATALERWAAEAGARFVVAVGDGANDVCMLEAADLGVAVEPAHPRARKAAHSVVGGLSEVPALVDASRPPR